MKKELFAIYKNGQYKGNERGLTNNDAIRKYVIASSFEGFLVDAKFMAQYAAIKAVN